MMRSTDDCVAAAGPRGAPHSDAVATVAQIRPTRLVALFLAPGAVVTIAFVLLAPLARTLGMPPLAALLAAIAFVLVPIELGIVLRAGPVPYRHPIPARTWAWLVPVLILAAIAGSGLGMVVEPAIRATLFDWLPPWFTNPLPVDRLTDHSAAAWIATLAAYLVLNGVIGPVVEELYFRGYLLPRMQYLGRWAPLVNVTLFSLYHLWSPWQLISRIIGFAPTVYAVNRWRNVWLGMVIHCTLNIIGVASVIAILLGRL
jgi:membrane protease YdiL (CAAX protease family)